MATKLAAAWMWDAGTWRRVYLDARGAIVVWPFGAVA